MKNNRSDAGAENSNTGKQLTTGDKGKYLTFETQDRLDTQTTRYGLRVGTVYAWDRQAFSVANEDELNAFIEDLWEKEDGVAKGFALRAVDRGEQSTDHISISSPIVPYTDEDGDLKRFIQDYAEGFLDYVENRPELMSKIKNEWVLEIIPLRAYRFEHSMYNHLEERDRGPTIKEHLNTVENYGVSGGDGSHNLTRGLVSLASEADGEMFDPDNEMEPVHISELVRSSEGRRVKMPDDVVIEKVARNYYLKKVDHTQEYIDRRKSEMAAEDRQRSQAEQMLENARKRTLDENTRKSQMSVAKFERQLEDLEHRVVSLEKKHASPKS